MRIQSTLSNSNSRDRKNVRITKSSKYRYSNHRGLVIFKRPENFVRISKSSNSTSSNETELTVIVKVECLAQEGLAA